MTLERAALPKLRRLRDLLEQTQGAPPALLGHQIPPVGDWRFWLLQAGRGAGKTLAICDYLVREARRRPGLRARIIGPTEGDAIESCVEGPSGVLAIAPEVRWRPSAPGGARLVWPNGSVALVLGTPTKRDVARLRASGNRHLDLWEELAANSMLAEAWPQAQLGLRLGPNPRTVAATTPVPSQAFRRIVAEADHVSRATIDDNPIFEESWRETMTGRYGGTSLGARELSGELLDEVEGALWSLDLIAAGRVAEAPDLIRVAVAVDPSGSEDGDEQGIVAVGLAADRHLYVLADRSCSKSPDGWAREVARLVVDVEADVVVWESNYGGDMVRSTLDNAQLQVPLEKVTASRGKRLRAEPVALLYERGLVHHVGIFPRLEAQQTLWVPGDDSPDRLDALVMAVTHLAPQATKQGRVRQPPAEWPDRTRSRV